MAAQHCAMVSLTALAVLAVPIAAGAQTIGYGDVSGPGVGPGVGSGAEATDVSEPAGAGKPARGRKGRGGAKQLRVTPYIEVDQIVDAQLSPGDEVLTYTQLAAGVDASISGRNNALAASVRYEHHFGWGKRAADGDTISGLVNGYATVAPGLTLEGGALATRARSEGGRAFGNSLGGDAGTTKIYSAYAGPSFATRAGDVNVNANYRVGYTKVDNDSDFDAGGFSADVFDKSVAQVADVEAGIAPGVALPVGLGVAGSFYQEDVSNLDQRVRDMQARGIVTVPLGRTVQATAAIGYEDVEVSNRDAVRSASGAPVIGRDGRYVTDKSSPRQIAYDVDGLIWDAGVMWRPSRRTALTAHIGRRYGTTSYNGTFSYAPNDRSALNIAVYDNVAGFGGQITRVLDELPDDFEAVRDPVSGELRGCVSSLQGNNCLAGALGSIRSATFRARGISASYGVKLGMLDSGVGVGYDRRKFIAARGTVLASANGVIDENTWLAAFLSGRIDTQSGWSTNAYANWLKSNDLLLDSVTNVGATASYYRLLTERLRATAAVGIDGVLQDAPLDDFWTASALLGVRYSF